MDSDRISADEGGFYAPAPAGDMRTFVELGTFTVDGETFLVRTADDDGSSHYDWVSGPNDGYGFSTSGGAEPYSRDHHVAAIRDFLSAIDPATGYFFDE
jgi:hypothetical protein